MPIRCIIKISYGIVALLLLCDVFFLFKKNYNIQIEPEDLCNVVPVQARSTFIWVRLLELNTS